MAIIVRPSGYELEIFKGIELNLDTKFQCTFCQRILKQAVQSSCGHRFCSECFQFCLQTNWECTKCLTEWEDSASSPPVQTSQHFPDNAIRRELNSLSIQCYFEGCDWKGSFKKFEGEHYESCRFRPRKTTCPFCLETILPENAEKQGSAGDVCHLMACMIKRIKSMEDTVGEIPVSRNRKPLMERIAALEVAIRTIQSTSAIEEDSIANERKKPMLGLLGGGPLSLPALYQNDQPALHQNHQPAQNYSPAVKELKEKLSIYEQMIAVLNREVEKLTDEMESVERQRRLEMDMMETNDRKVKAVERTLALKDVTIAELNNRIRELEETSYDGTLLWKISDFTRRRQEAISGGTTSFYSPPFYTSKTGYKMCARIYLNGDGMGKGSHVSLFFVVMRGHYDALLKWPFRHKVSMTFVDQSNREHVTDSFRPDPSSSSFRRPTTEMNIASGCPRFMSISQLDSSPLNAYVKDNVAFVKITISGED